MLGAVSLVLHQKEYVLFCATVSAPSVTILSSTPSKHRYMYDRWLHCRDKDRANFNIYPEYSPKLLEYALLGDLTELISAQWQLFQAIFDFGYRKRNKTVLNDKMQQIRNVRNMLAHYRLPPENELLRTRVLCTDILLALDQAGEGVE